MSAPLPNLSATPSLHRKALIHLPFPFALKEVSKSFQFDILSPR